MGRHLFLSVSIRTGKAVSLLGRPIALAANTRMPEFSFRGVSYSVLERVKQNRGNSKETLLLSNHGRAEGKTKIFLLSTFITVLEGYNQRSKKEQISMRIAAVSK